MERRDERAAVWNCVYYNVHTYQQSILNQMGTLIAQAHAQANPAGVVISAQEIVDHLKTAVKVRFRLGNVSVLLVAKI